MSIPVLPRGPLLPESTLVTVATVVNFMASLLLWIMMEVRLQLVFNMMMELDLVNRIEVLSWCAKLV
jgi:hypothetical protein